MHDPMKPARLCAMAAQDVRLAEYARIQRIALAVGQFAAVAAGQTPVDATSHGAQETRPTSQPATASQSTGPAARFDALFRFCPPDFESPMLVEFASLAEGRDASKLLAAVRGFAGKVPSAKPLRILATRHRFSMHGVGIGDFEGVMIVECTNDLPDLDSKRFPQTEYTRHEILGVPCFELNPPTTGERKEGALESWVALVDRRFILTTTRGAIRSSRPRPP